MRSTELIRPTVSAAPELGPGAGATIGPYELLRRVGRGGMGAVYLARHTSLDKQVAIKLLPYAWTVNSDAATRFQREIPAVGKLNHPAIVSATDAGERTEQRGGQLMLLRGVDWRRLCAATRCPTRRLRIAAGA